MTAQDRCFLHFYLCKHDCPQLVSYRTIEFKYYATTVDCIHAQNVSLQKAGARDEIEFNPASIEGFEVRPQQVKEAAASQGARQENNVLLRQIRQSLLLAQHHSSGGEVERLPQHGAFPPPVELVIQQKRSGRQQLNRAPA
jgi:hypothetical protein